ncbi:MAG: lytic murein transglycosylase, partial [Brachymonas sp.]|nr:lytic murein transglycosylase [Brachymonas sp.]
MSNKFFSFSSSAIPREAAVQRQRRLLLGGALIGLPAAVGLAACATRKKEPVKAPVTAKQIEGTVQQKRPAPAFTEAELGSFAQPMPLAGSYAARAEAMAQVPEMAQRLRLPEAYVRNAIGNANFLPNVPRLILPAGKGVRRNWAAYRSRFVEPVRIRAGVQFWRENTPALERAEREYGVPAHFIVGIIGVETLFGRHMGNLRVIDTLSTLSF